MSHSDEHETLSALIDGELTEDQLRFMLRRMDGHAALRASFSRYHLIGDGLRGELPLLADEDFAARVMRRIETSTPATVAVPKTRRHPHRWLRWSAGGAIAAGVAVAALVVTQPQMHDSAATANLDTSSRTATLAATGPAANDQASAPAMNAPAVPRWLQASPSAARMASPAAANFSSLGQWMRMNEQQPGYYERRLAPYMQLPHTRSFHRASAQGTYRLWPAPPPAYQQQAAPQGVLRLQAQ